MGETVGADDEAENEKVTQPLDIKTHLYLAGFILHEIVQLSRKITVSSSCS
jgi:hypothetical protein